MDKGFAAVMMWFLRRVSIDVYCKSVIETLENGALQLAGGGDEILIPSNQRSQYYNHHQTANKQTEAKVMLFICRKRFYKDLGEFSAFAVHTIQQKHLQVTILETMLLFSKKQTNCN